MRITVRLLDPSEIRRVDDAEPITSSELPVGYEFAFHAAPGSARHTRINVTEISSGMRVSEGTSRKTALKQAIALIQKHGLPFFEKQVQAKVARYGSLSDQVVYC